jgi:ElaB/YqjD/DUF883 family membrane-anchored ribosome-binding protein
MSFDTDTSVRALRTEAEITRARLTGTVEELRTQVADTATDLKERLSPASIKAEVSDYVRDSRDQLWHSLEQKARDNPLQAVAVGAALAYPALQLIRAMPAPLLLVGAGLLLSRSTGGASTMAADATGALKAQAQKAADGATGALQDATDVARRTIHDAQDTARHHIGSAIESATATATSLKDRLSDAAVDARSTISETADNITGQASDLAQQARTAVSNSWDQNPLLVAGIGLAIGAFIAAALPSTRTEEGLFGESSDALRRTAEGVAAKGVDAAKAVVDKTASAAGAQGLSVDGLSKLGENLTGKVRAVAERGVEAALGEAKSVNTHEGKQS